VGRVRADRGVTVALLASMAASAGLLVIYVGNVSSAQLEGLLLAVALGGVGIALVIWAIALLHAPLETEARHALASPPEVRAAAETALAPGEITRRRFLVRMLGGAGAFLAAALALPALSLGPEPGRALFVTGWRRGVRVVGEDGSPLRVSDLVADTVRTVFPEGEVGRPDSQTLLLRLRPEDLRLPADRAGWAPDGAVAYSKICTHAGCPVGLYRAQARELLCPCHQSTFDVTRGAVPVFGPAARPLPQLPLDVDAAGYLIAGGDFPEPVGPSFWNLTHDTPEDG
jgi:quinol---cytochrome c reductase iron-sulfur subunit